MRACLEETIPRELYFGALGLAFLIERTTILDSATTSVERGIDRTTTKKMNQDYLAANEVLFEARTDDVFLLEADLRSLGSSNSINYVDFRAMHPRLKP